MSIVIPAIDIINGKCVRLSKGDYNTEKVYGDDPLEMALLFKEKGATRIHIVDLDAARTGKQSNVFAIQKIIDHSGLKVQVGGGVRNRMDVIAWLNAGAEKVIVGSTAQKDKPEVSSWIGEFGSDKIIIGADVKDGFIAVHGWVESSEDRIENFIEYYVDKGARYFLCTDIMQDGMLQGPSLELYQNLLKQFADIQLIASGGVSSNDDIKNLETIGIKMAVVGKAIYEGKVNIDTLFKN